MSVIDYKTEQEIYKTGIDMLYQGLGASGFIRFIQQFNQGHGNYAEDRQQWQQPYSVDAILLEMKNETLP
ncbi:hypothetical protein [Methylovulum psychrotolerans]|jgi:hypothetical protein|uniref:Uncharacterized protein n=1 Tax=Methylovulum psychrotolerans TaxID=1704499 RepID=A0A1Z4BW89_9GAMM|nr:hypothetical protein [Methylovulum psychrotolerans]ASF45551.1 hypothetical protein CEK71_05420 [Methylovulum psychrotolerans]MBT9098500.1 hypothetical protein [Methylovulum psychrotolerans]POZ52912.1 hypothetical protein AADEFJLK_01523 [Methylovulum psychrotolerans]